MALHVIYNQHLNRKAQTVMGSHFTAENEENVLIPSKNEAEIHDFIKIT